MSRFASILFMLFAFLFGTVGSVSGAYNYASPELHSGDFLLWESEVSTRLPLELADPTREIGVWVYDDALGVQVYVTQNPWTYWDALGLQKGRKGWKNPSAARWKANGGWKGAAAGAWAGLSRGAVDSYNFVALNSPGLLFEAGVAKVTGHESVRAQETARAEAYKQEISDSVGELTGTDPNSANFKVAQTGGEILTPGIPAAKSTQLAAKGLQRTARGIVEETQDLFRAVGPDELADIKKSGKFSNPEGIETKYFSTSEEGASQYAKMAEEVFGDPPYEIVKTTIPKKEITPIMKVEVDGGIDSVVVPAEKLDKLSDPK